MTKVNTSTVLLGLAALLSLSFRTGYVEQKTVPRWYVTAEDPVVWLRFCEDEVFYVDEEDDDGDGSRELVINDFSTIKQAIVDEFNALGSSYLRVALHPDDPDAHAVTTPYDTTYDPFRAAVRTIDICSASSNPTLAGFATPKMASTTPVCQGAKADDTFMHAYCRHDYLASCSVVMVSGNLPTARHFTHTLLHELMHCLGVLHNHETHQSLMSYLASPQHTYRLTSDDKMALTFLYPEAPAYGREEASLGMACAPASTP